MKKLVGLLVAALVLTASSAEAYPTSAVFTPTGDAKELGQIGVLGWGSVQLVRTAAPGSSWFGVQAGLLPQWQITKDVKFGGLEVGSDFILMRTQAKPVFNLKLSPIAEGVYNPSLAVGLMEVSPALPSLSLVYGAVSKTLGPYGHLTAGVGASQGDVGQLRATFPFTGTTWLGMAAYESPTFWNRWGFVVDWLGGNSEVSSTYLGVTVIAVAGTTMTLGAFFSNVRANPSDGMFFSISTLLDARPL